VTAKKWRGAENRQGRGEDEGGGKRREGGRGGRGKEERGGRGGRGWACLRNRTDRDSKAIWRNGRRQGSRGRAYNVVTTG